METDIIGIRGVVGKPPVFRDGSLFIKRSGTEERRVLTTKFSCLYFKNIQKFNTQLFKGSKFSLPNHMRKISINVMA